MATYIDEDLVVVRAERKAKSRRKTVLAFGDKVNVLGEQDGWTEVRLVEHTASRRLRGGATQIRNRPRNRGSFRS